MHAFLKRLGFAGTLGALAAFGVRVLDLEAGVLSYLDANEIVSSFDLIRKVETVAGPWSGALLVYAATFLLVALSAYGAAAWKPVAAALDATFPGRPSFLRRPERRVEPFLAALGLTQPLAFYGRNGELAALDRFAAQPDRFLWWSIHGPGGVGKTRLAVEWMLRSADIRTMDVGFLDRDAASLASIRAFRPRRPTLIVADEALLFAPEIWSYIVELASRASGFRHAVRLLLIDWEPLAEPSGEVICALDSLAMQALAASRHYEVLRQSTRKPGPPGGPAASPTGVRLAETAGTSVDMVEVTRPIDSLLIRPFDDRSSIEALVADASRDGPPTDLQAIIDATEGNPLLIVAAALNPDQPPYQVIQGIARKMLHRARLGAPRAGVNMPTVLCLAALSGPIDRSKCADLAGGFAKPAELVKYFPLSRNEMRSALPALEPELLAHEIILQQMLELDPPSQLALAGSCIELNESRALRVIGNLWAKRTERRDAVALAIGHPELSETSDAGMEYAHVLNALAAAAEKSPGYGASPIRTNRGLAALALLLGEGVTQSGGLARLLAEPGGDIPIALGIKAQADECILPILSFMLAQIKAAGELYAAVFKDLPITAADASAVASGLVHVFVSEGAVARRRSNLTLTPANGEQIVTALEFGSPAAAAGACLELMEFAFQNMRILQSVDRLAMVERILPLLCRAIHEGPAGLRVAAAWACRWLMELTFSGDVGAALDSDQKAGLLEVLAKETNSAAVGQMIRVMAKILRRPEQTDLLLTWCRCIDSGQKPPPTMCDCPTSRLRDAFSAQLQRRASDAVEEFLRPIIGLAAIHMDALETELLPHVDAYLNSESTPREELLRACAAIGTSKHPMAVEVLRTAFSHGASNLRFGAFLCLWARKDWSFLGAQNKRPDDPVDYKAAIESPGRGGFCAHLFRLSPNWVDKLKAKDTTGKWAYYFVHIAPEREPAYLAAIEGDGIVDLETLGTVVDSSYGEEPTEELLARLRSQYGYNV